jgi:aryl-alcohol dehydrogenase-like predicted oxidoreductase
MIKRKLGNTGIWVSEGAFGGVEIGMPYGLGVSDRNEILSEAEAISLLHSAFDSGINFYDTARMYGNSENIIGKAFRFIRDQVVICTKCKHFLELNHTMPKRTELLKIMEGSFQDSLKALQTDYIDVYMLHQVNSDILDNADICSFFLNLKKEGFIRATGVSTYSVEETQHAIDAGIWDVIQLPFNLMDQQHKILFDIAHRKGVGIVIRSVLLKGLLCDRKITLHPALRDVEEHIARYAQLCSISGNSLSEMAMKFVLSFPEVSSVLVGIDSPAYLDQFVKAADGNYLDDGLMKKAKELAFPDPSFLNLSYWSKMNWLK